MTIAEMPGTSVVTRSTGTPRRNPSQAASSIAGALPAADSTRANLTVAVSIGLIWVLDVSIIQNFTGEMRASWVHIVVDGVLVAGMIPVKNAVVSAIEKGMRA